MDEGVSHNKAPGTVGVGGIVAGEERCSQCPLDSRYFFEIYSGVTTCERETRK